MTLLFVLVLHNVSAQYQRVGVIPSRENNTTVTAAWRAAKVFRWERYNGKPELLIREAEEAGINLISIMDRYFTQGDENNPSLIELADSKDIRVFIIFQTFYNDTVTIDASNSAIDAHGNRVKDSWLTFICPNEDTHKKQHLQHIEKLVAEIQPHGISLDFFRYFVYWEAGSEGERPQTCFCSRCMKAFENEFGITGSPQYILAEHADQWTNFKCNAITNYAKLIHRSVKAIKPDILLNLHTVPWKQDDYKGAIKAIAAQDLKALSPYFDFFQPMTYARMLGQNTQWIYDVGLDIQQQVGDKYVIPCIQSDDAKPENFELIAQPPLGGFSIWPFERMGE